MNRNPNYNRPAYDHYRANAQNMPYGNEGVGNPYPHQDFHRNPAHNLEHEMPQRQRGWDERNFNRNMQNNERNWGDLVDWADDVTNNQGGYPQNYGDGYRHGMFDRSNYGEQRHWHNDAMHGHSVQEMHTRERGFLERDFYDIDNNFSDAHVRVRQHNRRWDNMFNDNRNFQQPHHHEHMHNYNFNSRANWNRTEPGFYNNRNSVRGYW